MATAEQLKALLRSYSEADSEQFISVALQIAAHAARSGKTKLADDLKVLVQDVRHKQSIQRIGGADHHSDRARDQTVPHLASTAGAVSRSMRGTRPWGRHWRPEAPRLGAQA